MSTEKKRNLGVDILCCLGVMLLLGLEYFAAARFADMPMTGAASALPIAVRWLCLSGAMLLAAGMGYILNTRKFSAHYFTILLRLLYIYLVCSMGALIVRSMLLHEELSLHTAVLSLLRFTATDTGRIIGMYFALLLAAPFLNAAFHGLNSKGARMTFLLLTALPSTLQPLLRAGDLSLLPEWCKGLFPVAAYLGGAWIRSRARHKHVVSSLLIALALIAAQTVIVINTSRTLGGGSLYCPWLDSMASLPCLGIALCLLDAFHSRKNGTGTAHRFFAGAAGGALAALILGDPIIDCMMPALGMRYQEDGPLLLAGLWAVPVVFILCCASGLILQLPFFLLRQVFRAGEEEAAEDEEDEVLEDVPVSADDPDEAAEDGLTEIPEDEDEEEAPVKEPDAAPDILPEQSEPSVLPVPDEAGSKPQKVYAIPPGTDLLSEEEEPVRLSQAPLDDLLAALEQERNGQ